MKKIQRSSVRSRVATALARAPVVALLGPRQVGKTTLASEIAAETPQAVYIDLAEPSGARRMADARAFLNGHLGRLVVLDEIHRLPSLFAELRGIVDDRRAAGLRAGQFLILGSASLDLVQRAGESLAGRIEYVDMDPIGVEEAEAAGIPLDRLWLRGGFPESHLAASEHDSFVWRSSFVRSYITQDVPQFAPKLPAETIGRLWAMLAHAQGGLFNATRFAQALGITVPTVTRYVDLLVDLLLVRRLRPWSGNLGKRLVRSPKIYVRDAGVLHALLEIERRDHLLGHPVVGASWEGFVIENLLMAAGAGRTPLFYRTANGAEIDLLFERGGLPHVAVEIKLSSTPRVDKGFGIACDDLRVPYRFLVGSVRESWRDGSGLEVHGLASAPAAVRAAMATPR